MTVRRDSSSRVARLEAALAACVDIVRILLCGSWGEALRRSRRSSQFPVLSSQKEPLNHSRERLVSLKTENWKLGAENSLKEFRWSSCQPLDALGCRRMRGEQVAEAEASEERLNDEQMRG